MKIENGAFTPIRLIRRSDDVASAAGGVAGPLAWVRPRPGPSAVVVRWARAKIGAVAHIAALIAEGVVRWVVGSGSGARAGSWSDAAGRDLDVLDAELGPVARARAAVLPEP